MPSINVPSQVGFVPAWEYDYTTTPLGYVAVINVVGTYKDRGGYGYTEDERQVVREVWRSEVVYRSEEDAITAAVDKLADMARRV